MARRFYDNQQKVYKLFKNHPALSQLYIEFGIDTSGIKAVSEFLSNNDAIIASKTMKELAVSRTPNTYEPDNYPAVKAEVDFVIDLPSVETTGAIYYVRSPYPGMYYKWDGFSWAVDPTSKGKTVEEYLKTINAASGYEVWDHESGFFVANKVNNKVTWTSINSTTPDHIVIRKRDLPTDNVIAGSVYEVMGEDLLDIIATYYGLISKGYHVPWSNYVSARGTNLMELLTMTIYLYRYGTTDNFYEKHIWEFIPEYDREIMRGNPQIKLFMESIGRKLDDMEDKLNRLPTLYNIDECPDDMLDYLGQMLGYEKEDFSLSNLSFRELLKNIIDIYKVKGTNYSFSFFFKFLGFNVNLKEFYFNRDVENPEAFPGVDKERSEYYFSTTNPIYDTSKNYPAPHLDPIRNLNDWTRELAQLKAKGCSNPSEYMTGKQSYNNTGAWHSNPWKYFKTNLIEYGLTPFFDKLNLSSSDNETIKKYIRFLSPTYLFTWVNVNLAPWIDYVSVAANIQDTMATEIVKTLGKIENGKMIEGEFLDDAFKVWNPKINKFCSFKKSDVMTTQIINSFNAGKGDKAGTSLYHNGTYTRQVGHPSFISNTMHDGAKRLALDGAGIMIKKPTDIDYDYLNDIPTSIPAPNDGEICRTNAGEYWIYQVASTSWTLTSLSSVGIPNDRKFATLALLYAAVPQNGSLYYVAENQSVYRCYRSTTQWAKITSISDRYKKWSDYSYRGYPAVPEGAKPHNSTLNKSSLQVVWDNVEFQNGYWLQISNQRDFSSVVHEKFYTSIENVSDTINMFNDTYFWRIRTKNNIDDVTWTRARLLSLQSDIDRELAAENSLFISADSAVITNWFIDNGTTFQRKALSFGDYARFINICSYLGYPFSWSQWSNIWFFNIKSAPFPQSGQVFQDLNYQFITPIRDEITGNIVQANINFLLPYVRGAELYSLQVATNAAFTNNVIEKEYNSNTINLDISNSKTLYWRFRAKKYGGDWESWSNSIQFQVNL
jgi:hypothetical protein